MSAPIVIRQRAVEACIERFNGKPMKWGRIDCGRIVSHNLRHLGIATSLVKGLAYSSEHGALKALRSLGVTGLGGAMDQFDNVFRIPPAMATMGDVIGMKCDGEVWDMALTVAVGNGRLLAVSSDQFVRIIQPDLSMALAAWRCNPCRR